jgi:hypothetical protein
MAQVEIKFGGKPVRVELSPSDNYPDVPHKVLAVSDADSGQLYMPGPEMLIIEDFYQGKLDYELYRMRKQR